LTLPKRDHFFMDQKLLREAAVFLWIFCEQLA